MLSIVISTIAFFIASFFVNRWLDSMDIPKGMTRGTVIFIAAAAVSYGVAMLVDWAAGPSNAGPQLSDIIRPH